MKINYILIFTLFVINTVNSQVTQVTNYVNSSSYLGSFKMSNGNLIWDESSSSLPTHIKLYKNSGSITSDLGTLYGSLCNYADIYNDKVVWEYGSMSNNGLNFYNGTIVVNTGINAVDFPSIYENKIAYVNNGNALKVFDGTTTLTANFPQMITPMPHTDIWQNNSIYRDSEGLKFFDGNSKKLISNSLNIGFMKISGNAVLYLLYSTAIPAVHDLYYYKNNNSIKLNTNSVIQSNTSCMTAFADIDNEKAVWIEKNPLITNSGGLFVYYYDGNTTHTLASSNSNNKTFSCPKISGNNIVWICYDNSYTQGSCYLCWYDGVSIRYLSFIDSSHNICSDNRAPQLSGNFIAWIAYDINSYINNLYVANMTTLPEIPLYINNNELNDKVKIYPNPAKDIIVLDYGSLKSIKYYVSVYNFTGQLLLQNVSLNQKNEIDISELEKGYYFIKIQSEKEILMKEFIKE